jgi:hypothetical protein
MAAVVSLEPEPFAVAAVAVVVSKDVAFAVLLVSRSVVASAASLDAAADQLSEQSEIARSSQCSSVSSVVAMVHRTAAVTAVVEPSKHLRPPMQMH